MISMRAIYFSSQVFCVLFEREKKSKCKPKQVRQQHEEITNKYIAN